MRISIVTVYESMNCGAYLQAWTLKVYLENNGHQVTFLKNNSRNINKAVFKNIIRLLFKRKMQDLKMEIKNYFIFKKYHKNFILCYKKDMDKQDLFILGSDEIWNVSKKSMATYPIFWGIGITSTNIISYAPSANNATFEDIINYPYAKIACEKLKRISVRDTHTQNIIQKITDKPVELVSDPTMLLNINFYNDDLIKECKYKNYILIYDCYKGFSKEEIGMCVKFAKENNKKLISFGAYLSWCDLSIPADPLAYLSYFKNADYIFTGTFHGTIYSILFNRQFVSMGKIGMKVKHTLTFYDLLARILNSNDLNILAKTKINYSTVNEKITEMRAKSEKFLLLSLT